MIGLNVKGQNLHGMKDPRWTTFSKVDQYKRLISLQIRDKDVTKYMRIKMKRLEDRELGELRKLAKHKQDELRNALLGNQNRMWSTLGEHRTIQLALGRNTPESVIETLYQMIDQKRKMKDKQRYMKLILMRKYKELVLKKGKQDELIVMQQSGMKTALERKMNAFCQERHNAKMKVIAATSVKHAYTNISNILRKDAIYYNSVIECLLADCKAQSKMILSVTEMGQIVTEYVDDITTECNLLERGIKMNMKEREKSLVELRGILAYMAATCKKLIPTESNSVVPVESDSSLQEETKFQHELEKLEEVLSDVRDIALVAGYEHIYPRLVVQNREHTRLLDFKDKLSVLKESLVKGTKQLEAILNLISHTYNDKKIAYLVKKRNFLRSIRHEQKRLENVRNHFIRDSNKVARLRSAFQHIWHLVKNVQKEEVEEKRPTVHLIQLPTMTTQAEPSRQPISKVPDGEDASSVMALVKEKLLILHAAFKPDSSLVRNAYLFYCHAMAETHDVKDVVKEIDLLEGVILEDNRLPSHASVKKASAQFVADNTVDELALVAAQVAARRKPGAIFRKMMKEEEKRRKSNKCCGIY